MKNLFIKFGNYPIVNKAHKMCCEIHEGQSRKEGCPYENHPIRVYDMVCKLSLPVEFSLGALLHDAIEKGKRGEKRITLEEVKKEFGGEILSGVDFMTRDMNYEKKLEAIIKEKPLWLFIRLADSKDNFETPDLFNSVGSRTKKIKEAARLIKIIEDLNLDTNEARRVFLSELKSKIEFLKTFSCLKN